MVSLLLNGGLAVVGIHLNEISEILLIVFGLLLIVVIARIIFHTLKVKFIPESSVEMVIGVVIGTILWGVGFTLSFEFNAELFFLVLIPPIIYEAGFELDKKTFFKNIGLILLLALIGTLISTMATGLFVFGLSSLNWLAEPISLPIALAFGSLISAVDPVAVLAIFEQIHVNEQLNMLVFGESVLNDAVSIVLYNLFIGLSEIEESLPWYNILFTALGKFAFVSLGGICMGLFWGLAASFITKYTKVVFIVEVLVAVLCAFGAYLLAELFLMSGIVAILVAGMVQSQYMDNNISTKSHVALKYFLKLAASTADTIIFLELGTSTAFHILGEPGESHDVAIWDPVLIGAILPFLMIIRFSIVFSMTSLANLRRVDKVTRENQYIMAYGGLRGAIAFALAFIIEEEHVEARDTILTTTLIVVWFTVFVQGITIKPLLRKLRVKRAAENKDGIAHLVFPKAFSHAREAATVIFGGHPGFCGILHIGRTLNSFLGRIFVRGLYSEERELIKGIRHVRKHEIETMMSEEDRMKLDEYKTQYPNLLQHDKVRLQRVLHGSGDVGLSTPSGFLHSAVATPVNPFATAYERTDSYDSGGRPSFGRRPSNVRHIDNVQEDQSSSESEIELKVL